MTDLRALGGRVRELREAAGLSRATAARNAGMATSFLHNIEHATPNSQTGQPTQPSVPFVRAIAHALGADSAELLELAGYEEHADFDRRRDRQRGMSSLLLLQRLDPDAFAYIERTVRLLVIEAMRAQALGTTVAALADIDEVDRLTAAAAAELQQTTDDVTTGSQR